MAGGGGGSMDWRVLARMSIAVSSKEGLSARLKLLFQVTFHTWQYLELGRLSFSWKLNPFVKDKVSGSLSFGRPEAAIQTELILKLWQSVCVLARDLFLRRCLINIIEVWIKLITTNHGSVFRPLKSWLLRQQLTSVYETRSEKFIDVINVTLLFDFWSLTLTLAVVQSCSQELAIVLNLMLPWCGYRTVYVKCTPSTSGIEILGWLVYWTIKYPLPVDWLSLSFGQWPVLSLNLSCN